MTEFLLDRIGGEPALTAAVDEFYSRLIADEKLSKFFEGIDLDKLKSHQRKFLRIALTKIPASLDVEKFMYDKHKKLFLDGLNEEHFDIVAGHFVGTLQSLGVPQPLIDEAVGIIGPLRGVFESGASKAKEEEKESEASLLERIGGEAALVAAVDGFYTRLLADDSLAKFFDGADVDSIKKHQLKFMRFAFTKIPESINVEEYLLKGHDRLFALGLNGDSFDTVAGHLVATLTSLGVPEDLINEAVGIVAPLKGIFEKGAENFADRKKKNYLFDRLGGEAAIEAAVDEFYKRLVADDQLAPFFEGINMDSLKKHQRSFMKVAFTEIPKEVDVEQMMFKKHYMLFKKGLNETHFDLVAGHFVGTLESLGVASNLIDEAVGVIGPLRPIFEKGAQK